MLVFDIFFWSSFNQLYYNKIDDFIESRVCKIKYG